MSLGVVNLSIYVMKLVLKFEIQGQDPETSQGRRRRILGRPSTPSQPEEIRSGQGPVDRSQSAS